MQLEVCQIATLAAVMRLAHTIPVFPCYRDPFTEQNGRVHNAKSPYTRHGFLEASRDKETVQGWWNRWPDALVGVPTGEVTSLVVIDVDTKRLDTAAKWWIE